MSLIQRNKIASAVLAALLLGGAACGGSTNNDQGTSFLASGYYDSEGTAVNGYILPLASDIPNTATEAPGGFTNAFPADGLQLIVRMRLENRLTSQFLRVQRIDCSYVVPGASPALALPNDSFNASAVVQPEAQVDYAFQMISPDIYSYLNVNRNLLPELPFRMYADCSAIAVTQAGDTIVSNPLTFFVQFLDSAECCTGGAGPAAGFSGGFQQGPATGGDFTTDSGSSSGDAAAGTAGATGETTTTETTTTP